MSQRSIHPVKLQNYDLTYSMMSYIRAQTSTHRSRGCLNLHSKLIQTCKEFLAKNRLLFIQKISFNENGVYISDETKEIPIDHKNLSVKICPKKVYFDKSSSNWTIFSLN